LSSLLAILRLTVTNSVHVVAQSVDCVEHATVLLVEVVTQGLVVVVGDLPARGPVAFLSLMVGP